MSSINVLIQTVRKPIVTGLTQIEEKKEILDLKSRYFGVFNPLNPLIKGTFEPIA